MAEEDKRPVHPRQQRFVKRLHSKLRLRISLLSMTGFATGHHDRARIDPFGKRLVPVPEYHGTTTSVVKTKEAYPRLAPLTARVNPLNPPSAAHDELLSLLGLHAR